MYEGRVISQVTGHYIWIPVLIQVGDVKEWHKLDDVDSLERFADLADCFHVGDGCVGGLIDQLREVREGARRCLVWVDWRCSMMALNMAMSSVFYESFGRKMSMCSREMMDGHNID